jgi:hypothetical protein
MATEQWLKRWICVQVIYRFFGVVTRYIELHEYQRAQNQGTRPFLPTLPNLALSVELNALDNYLGESSPHTKKQKTCAYEVIR